MSDELIRKLDVIEIMENLIYDMSEVSTIPQLAKSAIEKLEPVNAVQFLPEYVCTNCKSRFPLVASEGKFYSTLCCENMNYCPYCGAKMEREVKSDD